MIDDYPGHVAEHPSSIWPQNQKGIQSDATLRLHIHVRPEADWFNAHEHEGGHYPGDDGHDARATWPWDLVATPDSWRDEAEMLREQMSALRVAADRLADAAQLPRNVITPFEQTYKGEWVAIPREDFDALRAALAAYRVSQETNR